uniref:Uncharacterized protein n=1 Tax=Oryza rufipogon TaxID=4529 RepID=A0A0E0NPZ9_ORYRU
MVDVFPDEIILANDNVAPLLLDRNNRKHKPRYKLAEDRKGPFPPQKLAIEVRGSPTYILGPLPFHNQCGTIQQSPPSHIGVPQPFTTPSPYPGPHRPTVHQPNGPDALPDCLCMTRTIRHRWGA